MLRGKAVIKTVVSPSIPLALHFHSLQVTSVLIDSTPSSFVHSSGKLFIDSPVREDTLFITVEYFGSPQNDGFGGVIFGDDYAYTVGQGIYSNPPSMFRYWAPSHDVPYDKASLDMHLIVPAPLSAFANGLLLDKKIGAEKNYFHWREDHPVAPYLICFAVGNYETVDIPFQSVTGRQILLQYHVFPDQIEKAKQDFADLPQMMTIFENFFFPYPFSRYSMIEAPELRGAMEHQTMTAFSSSLITGDRRFEYIVVHELAHHWWGNFITCADWKDLWLNEGFATYCEALYYEKLFGKEYLASYMKNLAARYFDEAARRGHFSVYNPSFLWGATVYQKGAWILHMLRNLVGDEAFFRSLRSYGEKFAYGSAVTLDLINVFEKESSTDLRQFFDQWVFQPGYPQLEISCSVESANPRQYKIDLEITQKQWDLYQFQFPLELVFVGDYSSESITLSVNQKINKYSLFLTEKPIAVKVDPEEKLLKMVTGIQTWDSLEKYPDSFFLSAAYPNPFHRGEYSNFIFKIPYEGAPFDVEAAVYNSLGRRVRRLLRSTLPAGVYKLMWDGIDDEGRIVSSGIYWIRVITPNNCYVIKTILLDK